MSICCDPARRPDLTDRPVLRVVEDARDPLTPARDLVKVFMAAALIVIMVTAASFATF